SELRSSSHNHPTLSQHNVQHKASKRGFSSFALTFNPNLVVCCIICHNLNNIVFPHLYSIVIHIPKNISAVLDIRMHLWLQKHDPIWDVHQKVIIVLLLSLRPSIIIVHLVFFNSSL
ncbi:hypothetical protein V8G54_008118, partial [Vigna mungo]